MHDEFILLKLIYGENNLDIFILRLSNVGAALAPKGLDYCLDKYPDFDTFAVWVLNQYIRLLPKENSQKFYLILVLIKPPSVLFVFPYLCDGSRFLLWIDA